MKNILGILLIIYGCNLKEKSVSTEQVEQKSEAKFDYSNYIIEKEHLGKIQVGTTIQEAEKHFSGLVKKKDEAENYGIYGGGHIFTYSKDKELLFGLVPYDTTDKIMCIVVLSDSFKTKSGLTPSSKVEEIYKAYPNMKVEISMESSEEYFFDEEKGLLFEFWTDEKDRVGKYITNEDQEKVKPNNLKIECTQLIINKVD